MNDTWETPDDLFETYNALYHFVLDAAADSANHKCPVWFGPGGIHEDALTADWYPYLSQGNIWLNPPYSRGNQRLFIEKALDELGDADCRHTVERSAVDTPVRYPGNVVALLPADTSTWLFHNRVVPHGEITFLSKRVRFKGATGSPKFGSMIVRF